MVLGGTVNFKIGFAINTLAKRLAPLFSFDPCEQLCPTTFTTS
jgi:hypothetical protein